MTDLQLYLAIGVPMLMNGVLFLALNSRMSALDSRMTALDSRMTSLEGTFTARFDLMMGKIMDVDTRLSILEDRLKK